MRYSDKNNPGNIAIFSNMLDSYERDLDDTTQIPCLSLKMALDRLLSAAIPDTYQMLRILTKRMTVPDNDKYSSKTLQYILTGINNTNLADLIIAIPGNIRKCIDGQSPDLSFTWLETIKYNPAVKAFIETYPTSEFVHLQTVPLTNILIPNESVKLINTDSDHPQIDLGDAELVSIDLKGFQPQKISFGTIDELTYPDEFDSSKPLMIKVCVELSTSLEKFYFSQEVKFTDTAKKIIESVSSPELNRLWVGDTLITLPAQFFKCRAELVSYNSGLNWIVTNLMLLPPSR